MDILKNLNPEFELSLNQIYKADDIGLQELQKLVDFKIPDDYIELIEDDIGKSFYLEDGTLFQVMSISSAISLTSDYTLQEDLPNSFFIGYNEGGYAYIYFNGNKGLGIYAIDLGARCESYTVFISKSLTSLLVDGEGIENIML